MMYLAIIRKKVNHVKQIKININKNIERFIDSWGVTESLYSDMSLISLHIS